MLLTIYLISDHTGITLEKMSRAILSQFDISSKITTRSFIDTKEKLTTVISDINRQNSYANRLIFSSITDPEQRQMLINCGIPVFDIFEQFLPAVANSIGQQPKSHSGQSHSMQNIEHYDRRIEAVNFALKHDDGQYTKELAQADIILIGLSRSGKTPVSLYLAIQYGIKAANYPITEDDFRNNNLPQSIIQQEKKLIGLTINAQRLQQIRQKRYPDSHYASLENCKKEIKTALQLLSIHNIRPIDTSHTSVEEIAAIIMQNMANKAVQI